jgi:hypothetical protein
MKLVRDTGAVVRWHRRDFIIAGSCTRSSTAIEPMVGTCTPKSRWTQNFAWQQATGTNPRRAAAPVPSAVAYGLPPQTALRVDQRVTVALVSTTAARTTMQAAAWTPVQVSAQLTRRIAVAFAPRTCLQTAAQTGAHTAFRTAPRTVPGTVPGATREASLPATGTGLALLTCCNTASYGEGPNGAKILEQI